MANLSCFGPLLRVPPNLAGDSVTGSILATIQQESLGLTIIENAHTRYMETRQKLDVLVGPASPHFTADQVTTAFRALDDEDSRAVAERIERGAYRLILANGDDFEVLVSDRCGREGCGDGSDPSRLNSVYVSQGRFGGPTLYCRTRPLNLPWNLSRTDVFFQLLANIVHDDRHHRDLSSRPSMKPTPEFRFIWELRAHGEEFLWRARHGDAAWLARFTHPFPESFVASFQKYYEAFY